MLKFYLPAVLVILCGAAHAGNNDADALFAEGLENIRKAQWAGAEKALAKLLKDSPRDPDAHALMGIARYHLGKYWQSERHLSFALSGGTRYRARSLYYLGMAYSKAGQERRAAEAFKRLLDEFPGSSEAGKVRSAAAKALPPAPVKKTREESNLKLTLVFEGFCDSNVQLTTDGDSDNGFSTYARARLDLVPTPLSLKLSFLLHEYFNEDEYDITHVSGGIFGKFKLSAKDTLVPDYTYQYYWLDYTRLQGSSRYELLWKREWTKNIESELLGRRSLKDYIKTDYADMVGDQDAGSLGLWYRYGADSPLTRTGLVGILTDNKAEEDYQSYKSWEAQLQVELTFTWDMTLDFEFAYGEMDYTGLDPDFLVKRFDKVFKAGAFLLQEISENSYLKLKAQFVSCNSTVRLYRADRWVCSAGIMIMF